MRCRMIHTNARLLASPYLAIDLGSKRIRVSVSDELGLRAEPIMTLERRNSRDDLRLIARIARALRRGRNRR
jgi:RNase H-fold protein (predicted Holliday junction resolvase)